MFAHELGLPRVAYAAVVELLERGRDEEIVLAKKLMQPPPCTVLRVRVQWTYVMRLTRPDTRTPVNQYDKLPPTSCVFFGQCR